MEGATPFPRAEGYNGLYGRDPPERAPFWGASDV